eukprot:gene17481-biopygen6391
MDARPTAGNGEAMAWPCRVGDGTNWPASATGLVSRQFHATSRCKCTAQGGVSKGCAWNDSACFALLALANRYSVARDVGWSIDETSQYSASPGTQRWRGQSLGWDLQGLVTHRGGVASPRKSPWLVTSKEWAVGGNFVVAGLVLC